MRQNENITLWHCHRVVDVWSPRHANQSTWGKLVRGYWTSEEVILKSWFKICTYSNGGISDGLPNTSLSYAHIYLHYTHWARILEYTMEHLCPIVRTLKSRILVRARAHVWWAVGERYSTSDSVLLWLSLLTSSVTIEKDLCVDHSRHHTAATDGPSNHTVKETRCILHALHCNRKHYSHLGHQLRILTPGPNLHTKPTYSFPWLSNCPGMLIQMVIVSAADLYHCQEAVDDIVGDHRDLPFLDRSGHWFWQFHVESNYNPCIQ